MPDESPMACSLTAAELPRRLAEMASVGRDALISSQSGDGWAALRFHDRDDAGARLRDIAAAEARCRAFLDLSLSEEGGTVVLTIRAPEGAASVMDDLVAAFRGASPAV